MARTVPSLALYSPDTSRLTRDMFADNPRLVACTPANASVKSSYGEIVRHLEVELETPLLDELYPHLWLVARKSGDSIDPLYSHRVKGRKIMAVDAPYLHLVWTPTTIYIKPAPFCLLDHEFWKPSLQDGPGASQKCTYLPCLDPTLEHPTVFGFLRSYTWLIRSRLDFELAKESFLIPGELDWVEWSRFRDSVRSRCANDVAKRYHYGQLRLRRLNWLVQIVRPACAARVLFLRFYMVPYWSISDLIPHITVPLLFIFTTLSLALSSMQVVLTIPSDVLWDNVSDISATGAMSKTFWVFSIGTLLAMLLVWTAVTGIPLAILVWQLRWGFKHR